MSYILQPGYQPPSESDPVHLDPDQLSAFMEDALPAHEREQTLAHLASCPHCRNLITLSTSESEDVPEPQPTRTRRTWVPLWVFAIPALAGIIPIAIYLRKPEAVTAPPAQIAETAAPAALQPPVPAPPAAPKPPPILAPKAIQSAAKPFVVLGAITPPPATISRQEISSLPAQGRNRVDLAPQTLPATSSIHGEAMGAAASPLRAAPAPQPAPAPPAVASASAATIEGSAASPALDATSFAADTRVAQRPLPSHLPILSTVSTPGQTLALDTQHTLYLTLDAGLHWTSVSAPWKAHALTVSLISAQPVPKIPAAIAGLAPIGTAQVAATTATLTGTLTDSTGVVIPNAVVTLTNAQSTYTTRTDRQGSYSIPNLLPGTYQLQARSPGFATETLNALNVPAQRQTTANLTLRAGAAKETVTVAAAPRYTLSLKKAKAASKSEPVFEVTTDNSEHWTSPDGITWTKK